MAKLKTQAVRALDEKEIPYRLIWYAHRARNAEEAAAERGVPRRRVVKTLLLRRPDRGHILALVRGDQRLSLKKLARIVGVKGLEMAPPGDVPRITGYRIGAVSPFGLRRPDVPVYIDQYIADQRLVSVSAGRHDAGLELDSEDLIRAVDGSVADITE